MNKIRIIFFTTLLLLLFITIISEETKFQKTGIIEEIKYSNNKLTLTLKNDQTPYILFTNELLNLKKEDKIIIYGKEETYKNQKQIIVSKIKRIKHQNKE